jgi:hypothetical protein
MADTWSNSSEPSVIENPIWSSDRLLWDATGDGYIAYPWVFTPANIWTNETKDDYGLVYEADFSTGSGTILYDKTPRHNDGLLFNDPTWVTDVTGGGMTFSDSDGSFVALTSSHTQLDGATAFSISFWIYPTSLTPGVFQGVYARGSTGQRCPWIYLDATSNNIILKGETNSGVDDLSGQVLLTQDTWQNVVFTWDGSNLRTYLDGVLSQTNATSGSTLVNTDGNNFLGKMAGFNELDGSIRGLNIYTKAISQAKITNLANN